METIEIKDFYNKAVGGSETSYEYNRWYKNGQKRASYKSTREAVQKYALRYLPKAGDILELGPGPGTWTKVLLENSRNSKYDLVDISEEMLRQAKKALSNFDNIRFINTDILDFVPDKKYDFFFSSRIIEYVPNKNKALKIVIDSLNSGSYGYLVTKTPHNRFWSFSKKTKVHEGQIKAEELVKIIDDLGCEIIETANVTSVFPGLRCGLLDRVLTVISSYVPFFVAKYFSESYLIIFKKK